MNKINWDAITLPVLPDGWAYRKGSDYITLRKQDSEGLSVAGIEWALGDDSVYTWGPVVNGDRRWVLVQALQAVINVRSQILGNPIGPAVPEKACDDCAAEPQLAQVTSVRYGVDPDSGQELSMTLEVTGLFGSSTLSFHGHHATQVLFGSGVSDVNQIKGKLCSVRVRDGVVSFRRWFK